MSVEPWTDRHAPRPTSFGRRASVLRASFAGVLSLLVGCNDLVGVDFGSAHLGADGSITALADANTPDARDRDGGRDDARAGDARNDRTEGTGDASTGKRDGAGPDPDAGPPACVPKSCTALDAVCGAQDDGCGGVAQCGSCQDGGSCKSGACTCNPTTCPVLKATCGTPDNGCGVALACGSCLPSQVCTGGACVCAPTTCAKAGANCGSISDGCGGTLNCGTCTGTGPFGPNVCGGDGPNLCGPAACVPTTCGAQGKNCGSISDGCGATLGCGACTAPASCGGAGVANVCGCTPTTCATLGDNCGTPANGCGGTLTCGACTAPNTCAGAGVADVCGCTPTTCAAVGATCGAPANGCGGTLDCGTCTAPDTCMSGKCACIPRTTCTIDCGTESNGCGGTIFCGICSCFGAGTDLTMADGSHRPIESIRAGDEVRSYDEATSSWVSGRVLSTIAHAPEEGTGEFIVVNGSLRLTTNHPVFVPGSSSGAAPRHAKRADLLRVGDPIVVLSAGGLPETVSVRTLDRLPSREVTYDLEVAGPGNFLADGTVVVMKINP